MKSIMDHIDLIDGAGKPLDRRFGRAYVSG